MPTTPFPIDLSEFQPLPLDPTQPALVDREREILAKNIDLCRDAIVFFTAVSGAKGLAGHTGGAFDTVPEVMIAYGFFLNDQRNAEAWFVPTLFDEAGHRVATQYLLSVLKGHMPAERLLHYRESYSFLPGHPEKDFTPGVEFSSGRLGHMWPFVNGVAIANPSKVVFLLGSDGSQMEGDDAEAARLAVAQNLNVKLLIDDNDVTIAGHPSEYMPGFDVGRTLAGHGLQIDVGDGEDLDSLFTRMRKAVASPGPVALINRRKMAVGIDGLEGSNHGHDSIAKNLAINYLRSRGRTAAADYLEATAPSSAKQTYRGSRGGAANRNLFGKYLCEILVEMPPHERLATVRVFDNDLEGSCGLTEIRKAFPEIFVRGGIMERGNFSAAAGFGSTPGKQGVFGTFSAFLEMVISELTMARLNKSNVLVHFSHSGCDHIADNTCHFGINNLFADNGLDGNGHDTTRLYFPADQYQFRACLRRVFADPGCRFLFSNRPAVPDILDQSGEPLFAGSYVFQPGRDDVVRPGTAGFVISFGECLHRALDAVERLRDDGLDVALINKATLNIYDEEMMEQQAASSFVLVVEGQNTKTGLGSRYGSELLKRGFKGRYNHLGIHKEGSGGLSDQMVHQGLVPESIYNSIRKLAEK
jgi:transketolase